MKRCMHCLTCSCTIFVHAIHLGSFSSSYPLSNAFPSETCLLPHLLASLTTLTTTRNLAVTSKYMNATNITFDYIIVGGGNAGLTLAARFSETPSIRVTVIEPEVSMRIP